MNIRTPIIPPKQHVVGKTTTLDYEAICVFAATGFFLDQDSYFKEQRVLKPACDYQIDKDQQEIISEKSYFKWHYSPKQRSFEQVVDEFADVFETIVKEQVSGKNVILPLSGGLDSRTQAVALHYLGIKTQAFSYAFDGGHDETWYAKKMAKICRFPVQTFSIPQGYLWNSIENLSEMNACYSEFTHPRQMAFVEAYKAMGDVFSLGHWGDVLFDDMGVCSNLSLEEQVSVILKRTIKKGGLELANSLWVNWELKGDFLSYLKMRIHDLLQSINIPENANAQIRAFKSLYWAPRWTTINLSVFEAARPITMPYYDNRMCEFICSVPEEYLAGRQLQIAYIKKRMPALAELTWEAHRPFNLYNYQYNKMPWNFPYRVFNKLKRLASNKDFIQRNWELQFLGEDNDKKLQAYLFDNPNLDSLVPTHVRTLFYRKFKEDDSVFYSHSVSMLLTLSVFSTRNKV
jgi:tRNA(Ile)-lysidine synthase TilS/MesJ